MSLINARSMRLSDEREATVRVLVPGNNEEGPVWQHFEGIDLRKATFSINLTDATSLSAYDGKLIINPNFAMLIAVDEHQPTSDGE